MKRYVLATSFVILLTVSDTIFALPGSAIPGGAAAEYRHETGEIVVSFTDVLNWYIEDIHGEVLTGNDPLGLSALGSMATDNDARIGSTALNAFSVTNLNLGTVAQPNLANNDGLKIFWNTDYGQPLEMRSIDFIGPNRSPTAGLRDPFSIDIANDPLNATLDASSSLDLDGDTISYRWDLNNDGIFEVDTGLISTLDIGDVTSTFGGLGDYPIAVEVFDGEYRHAVSATVQLVPTPQAPTLPEPPAQTNTPAEPDDPNDASEPEEEIQSPPPASPVVEPTSVAIARRIADLNPDLISATIELPEIGNWQPLSLPNLLDIDNIFDLTLSHSLGGSSSILLQPTTISTFDVVQVSSIVEPIIFRNELAFSASLVPEPTSLALAVLGVVSVNWCRRK